MYLNIIGFRSLHLSAAVKEGADLVSLPRRVDASDVFIVDTSGSSTGSAV